MKENELDAIERGLKGELIAEDFIAWIKTTV